MRGAALRGPAFPARPTRISFRDTRTAPSRRAEVPIAARRPDDYAAWPKGDSTMRCTPTRTLRHWCLGLAAAAALTGAAAQEAPLMVLSPKATSAGWSGVHRPHTKLADVLARHHGETDWAETVVDDESLFAQWISMGPGQKT